MTEQQGLFTIPARLYLTSEQRAQLTYILQTHEVELGDLLTEIVVTYLQDQPPAPNESDLNAQSVGAELRERRAALAKLRAQRGSTAGPAWINAYIAQLEAEIHTLEAQQ